MLLVRISITTDRNGKTASQRGIVYLPCKSCSRTKSRRSRCRSSSLSRSWG